MNGHTEEPLYKLIFPITDQAARFVERVREAIESPRLHRRTPPGPLVIYGPKVFPELGRTELFVTAGILRVAELLELSLPEQGPMLSGASLLPHDVLVLLATLGGVGDLA